MSVEIDYTLNSFGAFCLPAQKCTKQTGPNEG